MGHYGRLRLLEARGAICRGETGQARASPLGTGSVSRAGERALSRLALDSGMMPASGQISVLRVWRKAICSTVDFRFNNSLRYNFRDALSPHFNFATSLLNESLITTGPAPVTNAFEHRIFFLLNFQKNSITLSPGYQVRFLDFQPDFLRFRHGFIFWLTYNYRFKDFKRKNFDVLPTDKM
jgi:hypothetical protein